MDSEDTFDTILNTLGFNTVGRRNDITNQGVISGNDLANLTSSELQLVFDENRTSNRRRTVANQVVLSITSRTKLEALRYEFALRKLCNSDMTAAQLNVFNASEMHSGNDQGRGGGRGRGGRGRGGRSGHGRGNSFYRGGGRGGRGRGGRSGRSGRGRSNYRSQPYDQSKQQHWQPRLGAYTDEEWYSLDQDQKSRIFDLRNAAERHDHQRSVNQVHFADDLSIPSQIQNVNNQHNNLPPPPPSQSIPQPPSNNSQQSSGTVASRGNAGSAFSGRSRSQPYYGGRSTH